MGRCPLLAGFFPQDGVDWLNKRDTGKGRVSAVAVACLLPEPTLCIALKKRGDVFRGELRDIDFEALGCNPLKLGRLRLRNCRTQLRNAVYNCVPKKSHREPQEPQDAK